MKDARWRLVLCWGTVITFLTLPLTVFVIAIWHPELAEQLKGYKFIAKFFESITALVFGLSGLRSVDKFVETKKNGNGNGKPSPEKGEK